jgi:hypothetical protein
MNVYNIISRNHHKTSRITEVMAQPGELSWGAPGWSSTDTPSEDGPYVIHYSWGDGHEFVGVDYFVNGRWERRWCDYPRFEWLEL